MSALIIYIQNGIGIVIDKPSEWLVGIVPEYFSLQPNATENITVSISIPRYTPPGNYTMFINCKGPATAHSFSIDISVRKHYEPVIMCEAIVYTLPGRAVITRITVKNEGNCLDTFELSCHVPESWACTLILNGTAVGNISLLPNQSKEIMMSVGVPLSASEGVYLIGIRARSTAGMNVSEGTVRLQVELPQIRFISIQWPERVEADKVAQYMMIIENFGNVSLSNVTVKMYVNGKETGYENVFERLASGSAVYATFYWRADAGTHTVQFVVTTENSAICESFRTYECPKRQAVAIMTAWVYIGIFITVMFLLLSIYFIKRPKRRKPQAAPHISARPKTYVEDIIHLKPPKSANIAVR